MPQQGQSDGRASSKEPPPRRERTSSKESQPKSSTGSKEAPPPKKTSVKKVQYPDGFEKECREVDAVLSKERSASVDPEERKRLFRKISSKWHPDKQDGVKEVFQYLQERKTWFVDE